MSLHVLSSKYVKALPQMCLDWDHSLVLKSSERTDFRFCHPVDFWICCYCYLAEMVMCTLILHDIYVERDQRGITNHTVCLYLWDSVLW